MHVRRPFVKIVAPWEFWAFDDIILCFFSTLFCYFLILYFHYVFFFTFYFILVYTIFILIIFYSILFFIIYLLLLFYFLHILFIAVNYDIGIFVCIGQCDEGVGWSK